VMFFRNLLQRLESAPEVKQAAVATDVPATGATEMTFRLKTQENVPSGERPRARYFAVSANYLGAAGIPLIAGREFTEADSLGSAPVALVSEVFVRRFFPKGDALGQTILIDSGDANQTQWRQIVGVVANVKNWPLQNADDPEIYEPFLQHPASDMAVILRTDGNPSLVTPALRQAVWSLDKDLPLGTPVAMQELLTGESAGERVMETMLSVFSGLALLLSAVGLYGLLSHHVMQRRREIGIRLAMGAGKGNVLRLVLQDGMQRALIGAGIGTAIALPLPKLFTAMFQDFYVRGEWLFVVVPLVMVATAILACYVPARRAARVDPMVALRYE
jgi:putative ABC transport system permease protein